MQGNLHQCTDQELDDLEAVAKRANDWRSLDAILHEIKDRQDAARRHDMDTIRRVAEVYSEEGLRL